MKKVLKEVEIKANFYRSDSNFTTNNDILNIHPTIGTHWFLHINE